MNKVPLWLHWVQDELSSAIVSGLVVKIALAENLIQAASD